MKSIVGIAVVIMILAGNGFVCTDAGIDPGPLHPQWVDSLITVYSAAPVGNPPQSIWQYHYTGATVYFIPAQCCDQYSDLYDLSGNLLGHPDGGIAGTGDGRCSDFFKTATDPILIWRDTRSRN